MNRIIAMIKIIERDQFHILIIPVSGLMAESFVYFSMFNFFLYHSIY